MGQFSFSIALIATILLCLFIVSKQRISVFEPTKLTLYVWLISFVFLLIGGVNYEQEFSSKAFFVMALGIVLFSLGGVVGDKLTKKVKKKKVSVSHLLVSALLYLFSVTYIILLIVNKENSLSILYQGFSSLGDIRTGYLEYQEADSGLGIVDLLLSVSRSGVFISIMYFSYVNFIEKKRRSLYLIMILLVINLFVVLEGLSKGGRSYLAFIVFYTVLIMISARYSIDINKKRRIVGKIKRFNIKPVHIVGGLIFLYFIFVYFPIARNENLQSDIERYLNFRHPSEFQWWIEYASSFKYFEWVKSFSYGSGYISTSLVKAVYFIEEEKSTIRDSYYMGMYNAKVLVKLASVFDPAYFVQWNDVKVRIAEEFAFVGYNKNPWATIFRDAIIDFGIWGSAIFMLIFGFLTQFYYKVFYYKGTPLAIVIAITILAISIFSPFFGTLTNNTVIYPFVLSLFIYTFARLLPDDSP